jgi:translocation and assembly module TamB
MQVEANLAPLHLDDLLPDGKGVLRGSLKLRGARNAPDIEVDLDGSGIAFGDYRAEHLSAKGRLPWRSGNGALAIDARGVEAGTPLSGLQANLRGAVERLQFDANAQGEIGTLSHPGRCEQAGRALAGHAGIALRVRATTRRALVAATARALGPGMVATARCRRPACAPAMAADLCANADWPRRGLELQGDKLPLALAVAVFAGTRRRPPVGAAWRHRPHRADFVPVGNAWRGSANVTSAAGGVRNRARARRDLVGYRDLVLDAEFDPQSPQRHPGRGGRRRRPHRCAHRHRLGRSTRRWTAR